MRAEGSTTPTGSLGLQVIRGWPARPATIRDVIEYGLPNRAEPDVVNEWRLRNTRHLWRGVRQVVTARALKAPLLYGQLWLRVFRGDGTIENLGLASLRVVTDTGVGYIVDAFQNLVEPENMKFHGFGTGGTAEAASQTALVTEETTQYATDNTRPTGTTVEGASANIYRTVATYSPDSGATRAITEHGIFSQAATGGGVMLDRTLFSVVNLVAAADSLQATYELTFPSGG
jgi:hypothetical protein